MNPEDFAYANTCPEIFEAFKEQASIYLVLSEMDLEEKQYRWNWFLLGWRIRENT
jgi:hypothetical protein